MARKGAKIAPFPQSADHLSEQQNSKVKQALALAVQHHTAGRLPEAESLYRQILQSEPNQPEALRLLGLIAHQEGNNNRAVELISKALAIEPGLAEAQDNLGVVFQALGKHEEAVNCFQRALKIKPNDPLSHNNLAVVFTKIGRFDDAVASCRRALKIKPDYAQAHNNLGNALKELGKPDEAITSYNNALAAKPDFAGAHNNLGSAFFALGRLDDAVACCHKALAIMPDYAEAHHNLGWALQEQGKLEEAVASYRQALAVKPDFAQAQNNLGSTLEQLGRIEEAVASHRQALKIKPDFAEAHNNMGNALEKLGKYDEALASYRKALAIDPGLVAAHINLIVGLEHANRTEALREAVNHAKRTYPGHPLLALGEAFLLKRDGDVAAARTLLEEATEAQDEARLIAEQAHLLGDLCDTLEDTEAAFSYFAKNNQLRRDSPGAKRINRDRFPARIDDSASRFTADWVAAWRPLESIHDRPDPVFLVGFPRSGTTLVDTILRSHAAITVVEEMPTVGLMRHALTGLSGGGLDGLADLEPERLAKLRQIYFAELDKHLKPENPSGTVVDKLPLNIVEAGLIHRIFPNARFLMALRHPCDCVLSCFMQDFVLNDAMVHFLDLQDAARLYDKVMSLWQQYQKVLPLAVHTVRYESLIEAFEETLTPVFDFLGVDWDEGVRDYAETGRRRGRINTPSYDQVTQPLYTQSRGRWERYREQMQPVLPLLLPWAKRFGYGE